MVNTYSTAIAFGLRLKIGIRNMKSKFTFFKIDQECTHTHTPTTTKTLYLTFVLSLHDGKFENIMIYLLLYCYH